MMKIYQQIAQTLDTKLRCELKGNPCAAMHQERIDRMMQDAPSGSGFDSGTELSDDSDGNRLVFETAFHHMDENGYYDGWSNHKVIVKPDLAFGFDLQITGRNKNEIKDYIADVFNVWLNLRADYNEV